MENKLPQISKELSKQIEREARLYAKSHGHKEIGFSSLAYEAGATAYAHYKEQWEEAVERIKLLEKEYDILFDQKDWAEKAEAKKHNQFEQAMNALEQIANAPTPYNLEEMWSWIHTARNLADTALASWREEGKEASAPVDGPRESGYYKVRLHGNWVIAEYFNYVEGGNHWYVCGNETYFADQDFQQIGERLL